MPEFPIHGSPFFDVREFVSPEVWRLFGPKAAMFVDKKTVAIADQLRETAGPIFINDWMFGGKFVASGFRERKQRVGGEYSQHRLGKALDAKSKRYKPAQMLAMILKNPLPFYEAGLTRIEDVKFTPTWLHLDCAAVEIQPGEFVFVQP